MDTPSVSVILPTLTSPSYAQKVIGRKSPLSSDVEEFLGIPYGIVPARWEHSHLRLSLPQDVYHASANGPKCPQPAEGNNSDYFQSHLDFPADVAESEFDCLDLFIVRPSADALTRKGFATTGLALPVLVWIHGGGYAYGAGTDPMWDPTRLVTRSLSFGTPIIAVCINYRLNVFGFLGSSDILSGQEGSQIKGCNFGLRDQKVGLNWISLNISSFGGDPRNITVGGQSAGACSVHAHILEAKFAGSTTPLFRRAIIQSGAVQTLGPIPLEFADLQWDNLCASLGIHNEDGPTRVRLLQEMKAADIVRAGSRLGWTSFPMVLDNLSITETSLECKVKFNLGDVALSQAGDEDTTTEPISILIGDTDAEGSIFYHEVVKIQSFHQLQSIFQDVYPSVSSSTQILNAYRLSSEIPLKELHQRITLFVSDVLFGYPIYSARNFFTSYQPSQADTVEIIVDKEHNDAPNANIRPTTVQAYKVEFGNPFPGPNHNVSHHCVELIYVFDAFHDALRKADESSTQAAEQRGEGWDRSVTSPILLPDSGYVSRAEMSQTDDLAKEPSASSPAIRPNADLVLDMQTQWINFIIGKHSGHKEEKVLDGQQGAAENARTITVYGADRVASVQSLTDDVKWVEQRKRYEVLALHPIEYRLATRRITNSTRSLKFKQPTP